MIDDGKPLLKSMVADWIWDLMTTDPEQFKKEVTAYFAKGYPRFKVVRAKRPFIYLKDERG